MSAYVRELIPTGAEIVLAGVCEFGTVTVTVSQEPEDVFCIASENRYLGLSLLNLNLS